MSDDIVQRLERHAAGSQRADGSTHWGEVGPSLARAALTEIGRLRAALHFAAGLLSSCAPYDQMHPDRVLELLTGERHHDHHEST